MKRVSVNLLTESASALVGTSTRSTQNEETLRDSTNAGRGGARRRLRAGVLCGSFLGMAVVLSPAVASASYAIDVWFLDDEAELFEAGDVSSGSSTLDPPSWACGFKINDPAYYRWVNGYGSTMSSANLSKDVYVWVPKAGCPVSSGFPLVEYSDGSHTFNHLVGAYRMEITTSYSYQWFDEDGSVPSCTNCTVVGDLRYSDPYDQGTIVRQIAGFKRVDFGGHNSLYLPNLLLAIQGQIEKLQATVAERTAYRQRFYLERLEAPVRELEDRAERSLAEAHADLLSCRADLKAGRYHDAYVACDRSASKVETSERLLDSATGLFSPTSGSVCGEANEARH